MSTAVIRKHNRLTIPKEIMTKLGLHEDDTVDITVDDGVITIKPKVVLKKIDIKELYKDFDSTEAVGEVEWGVPKGDEVW